MEQYTFKVDSKDPLYKKLIKLPTAYYRLKGNSDKYAIESYIGTVEVRNISDVELQKRNDKIVLCKGDLVLKLQNGEDFVIEQEAIIGENKNSILDELETEKANITLQNIGNVLYSGINLSLYKPGNSLLTGSLNFINFYDENDIASKEIKEKTDGFYLTIKGSDTDCLRTVYISDKNGNRLSKYSDYQYQYKPDIAELETIDSLIKASNTKQKFTLQKGKELSDNIYEANIVLNDNPMATLQKIGYYMLNDQLVIRNHVTKEEIVIPRDFHYLKVAKCNNSNYKLTFCNFLGNEFFEYKRYDPQYSHVSDEYKFISLNCAEKIYNTNFAWLHDNQPLFFLTEEFVEPDFPDHYSVAVYELVNGKKGRQIVTLVDEFGYFNKNGQFKYHNYYTGTKYTCNPCREMSIEKKCTVIYENSEFYSVENDNIILHNTSMFI
ncbi:MAG TPA: hypothetical protein DEQ74_01425 [Wolbachia sp.]|uniref:hypothetical protein n=1 Tax=Wolbachia endosymbiont of Pentalonia nigronervosa TaxID=1301914 RepID=UPI000EE550A6|nr:hypothetical protein [Wolbachia endosymbiont of Pentalonia nigronervosa]MBD0391980.1 hypothetical protein [Wolbachia endosymbiont of Pentalonia nigronervosa]HCE59478.1 hypothetical protein [Wolbachia sp.]